MSGENKNAKTGRDRGLGEFTTRPLTPQTWADLEQLFDLPGGSIVRGCWCKFYRRSGKPPGCGGPPGSVQAANKQAMCEQVESG
ncbi:MAG: hypothetical protein ACTHKL_03805, partial [Streptosporangiaceae bacterium]